MGDILWNGVIVFKFNGKVLYVEKYKIVFYFIGGNWLENVLLFKVKDFVVNYDGYIVIINVSVSLIFFD